MTEQGQLIPLGNGERLRKQRIKRKLTVEEAANALHVPVDVVTAIEAEELARFAPVYRRGYIQSYARFLGVAAKDIEKMVAAIGAEEPELLTVFPEAARHNPADRWLRATSYVLASLLIGTLAWQFTHEAVRLSQRNAVVETGVQPQGATAPGNAGAGVMREPATHVNASIAALETLQKQREYLGSSPGEDAWSALRKGNGADPETAALPEGEHLLNVTTSGDSWVEITDAQGRQLELDLVRGGSDKQYQGKAPFRILFGRASAVDLFMDGEQVDIGPFTSGDVTQMTLKEAQGESGDPADSPESG